MRNQELGALEETQQETTPDLHHHAIDQPFLDNLDWHARFYLVDNVALVLPQLQIFIGRKHGVCGSCACVVVCGTSTTMRVSGMRETRKGQFHNCMSSCDNLRTCVYLPLV